MIRGTTPTYILKIDDDVDFGTFETIEATIRQKGTIIRKTGDNLDVNSDQKTVAVTLSQDETLRFDDQKPAMIQIRIKDKTGNVFSHTPIEISVDKCLSEEVI